MIGGSLGNRYFFAAAVMTSALAMPSLSSYLRRIRQRSARLAVTTNHKHIPRLITSSMAVRRFLWPAHTLGEAGCEGQRKNAVTDCSATALHGISPFPACLFTPLPTSPPAPSTAPAHRAEAVSSSDRSGYPRKESCERFSGTATSA